MPPPAPSSLRHGRAGGSAIVNGRGHVGNQHGDRGGRGGQGGRGSKNVRGVKLPTNTSKESELLAYGLACAGFGQERQRCREMLNIRRFRAHYGVSPKAIAALVHDMKHHQNFPVDITHLFMALAWLRIYETEELMAGRWGYGEQYCRDNVKEYVLRIQSLKPVKISFRNISRKSTFAPVDVVHIRTQEFTCDPNSKWWSHKSNGPAVAWEAVTDPVEGKIAWINGPEPPTLSDIKFLRGGEAGKKNEWKKTSLYNKLPAGLRLVGDSAYDGQPDKVSTTKDAHDSKTKKLFARMKSLQESVFKRMKDFKVLRDAFRHGKGTQDKLEKIKMVFEAVAVLVEYDIENGHPLFEV